MKRSATKFIAHSFIIRSALSGMTELRNVANYQVTIWILFLALTCACSKIPDSSTNFVENLFKGYEAGNEAQYLNAGADTVFSSELLELIRLDQKQADGDVGLLNFDPICDCQDYQISKVETRKVHSKDSTASVKVSFQNFSTKVNMTFHLVFQNGKWKIKDIQSKNTSSLLDFLRAGLIPKP